MRHPFVMICLCSLAAPAIAQNINIPAEMADEAALPRVMPRFAKAVMASQEDGRIPDLASLFRARLVAGFYGDALETLDRLRAPLIENPSPRVRARYWEYVLYARSALRAAEAKSPFQDGHSLDFRSMRLMSRQMGVGSRLVAVLSILKEPEREIDYGTGQQVIDESISDAKVPLRMTWFASSYLDLPVYK
jgi:hypothetical protein